MMAGDGFNERHGQPHSASNKRRPPRAWHKNISFGPPNSGRLVSRDPAARRHILRAGVGENDFADVVQDAGKKAVRQMRVAR